MNKKLRLRRRIDHQAKASEEIEMDGNNESPMACVDCGKRYPLIGGSSNARCKGCNTTYKRKIGFSYAGFTK